MTQPARLSFLPGPGIDRETAAGWQRWRLTRHSFTPAPRLALAGYRRLSPREQGGPLSPLLCNVYLHQLDRAWQTRGAGVLVRYCDDLVAMCATKREAERALAALTELLAELELAPKAAKTRIVHLVEGGEGVDFLGFHHRLVRGRTCNSRHLVFLARWPSRKAMQHARDRIRQLTARERLLVPVEQVVQDLNRFLRGWAGFFRYGNSARYFDKIRTYAVVRLASFVAKRHKRRRSYGWAQVAYQSPDCMG